MASYMETTTMLLIVTFLLVRIGTAEECNKEKISLDGHDLHVSYMQKLKGDFDGETITLDEPTKIKHLVTISNHKIVATDEQLKEEKKVDTQLTHPKSEGDDKQYDEVMKNGNTENAKKVKTALATKKDDVVGSKAEVKKEGKVIGSMRYLTHVKNGKKVSERATYIKFDLKTYKKNPPAELMHYRQTNYHNDGEKIQSYSIGTSYMGVGKYLTTVIESVMHDQEGKVNEKCPKVRSLFTDTKEAQESCNMDWNISNGHNLHVNYMRRFEGDFNVETVTVDEPKKVKYVATIKNHKIKTNQKLKKEKEADPNLAIHRPEDDDTLYNKMMATGEHENEQKVNKAVLVPRRKNTVKSEADVKEEGKTIGFVTYVTHFTKNGIKIYQDATYRKFAPRIGEEKHDKKRPKVVLVHRRQTNYLPNGKGINSYSIGTSYMKDGKILSAVFESVMHDKGGKVNEKCPKVRSLFTAVKMSEKQA